jgi:SNF2 family DNA or RNA helicase
VIVLHGAFAAGDLLVWGEIPKTNRRSRKYVSPYDAGAKTLLAALPDSGKTRPAIAWLPTVAGQPLPSSPLISSEPAGAGACALEPWEVTALLLRSEALESLLMRCAAAELAGEKVLEPGVVIGDDLLHWAHALQFAGALVTRQQFLPDIVSTSEGFHARWTPVFDGDDIRRLADLAQALPSVARALSDDPRSAPAMAARTVVSAFIAAAVDGMVRATAPEARKTPSLDSVHDLWLHALHSGDGAMNGDASQIQALAKQVREWRRPIQIAATAPYRLCFRMEEPEGERDDWKVQYLLQSRQDHSLLVPAEQAWNADGKGPLGKQGPMVREHLLVSLAQAAGIDPRIETSLRGRAPSGYTLDVGAAHEFLTTRAAALEQNGFGVMLPAWWTRTGGPLRLTARATVKSPMTAASGLSLDAILHVEWQVALGDHPMSLSELRALAALKVPLVKVRGHWVQVSAEEIRAAIEFLQKKKDSKDTVRDVVRMALGATAETGPLEISGVTATGWVADVLAQLQGQAQFEELQQPRDLTGQLRPYQARGFSWLAFLQRWGLGACLADDMGLGKTIQTLALVQHAIQNGEQRPVLLICPTSVVGTWKKEAARFTPELPVLVHHGVTRAKGEAFQKEAGRHAMVLSTYALLHRDLEILRQISWAGVILDEAQNIKNPETKQAKAARTLPAAYRIALTGTPVENNVGDLWSIMEFLNPGLLGNRSDFRNRFFVPIQMYGNEHAAERLKKISGPFVLRRLKTDKTVITDLPDKLEMKVFCTLTKEQASLYAAVVKEVEDALESAEGIQRKGLVLATISKLKQICNHPAQFLKDNSAIAGRSGKLARITEMLEEVLAAGDRALIFSQFTEMGELLRNHLEYTFGREVLFLHGGVTKKRRDDMVERFSAAGGPPIFLLSLKAGGTGLNLTGANHVFHFDRWWNPAVENQATDRAFRIGQTRNVQVHKFLCAGTLEDRIDEMIERKKAVAGLVVGTGEGWLTELSNMELKKLFELSRDAVEG